MSAEQTAFQVFTSIAIVLILLPAPWHWSARNCGTLLYIGWTFLACVIYLVNSIIWNESVVDVAPVWCDITTKFTMGLGVAFPAVSLAINRRLYNIATMKHVVTSYKEKRKQTLIDLGIGLGIPCLVMAFHYIVQGHRFDIVEDIGCVPTTYMTPPAVFLLSIWPPTLGLISFVYASLSIRAFLKQRRNFSANVAYTSSMNASRYLRLIALAMTDIIFDVPLSIYVTYCNTYQGLAPWISWADTHSDFNRVDQYPKVILQSTSRQAWNVLEMGRWAAPAAAWLFFLYFGLAGESLAAYRRSIAWIVKKLPVPENWKHYIMPGSRIHIGSSQKEGFSASGKGPSKPIGALPLYSKTSSMATSPTLTKTPPFKSSSLPSPPLPHVIKITRSREVVLDDMGGEEQKYSMRQVDVKLTSSCITYSPEEICDSYATLQGTGIAIPSPGVTIDAPRSELGSGEGRGISPSRFAQQQQIGTQRVPMDVEAQHPSDADEYVVGIEDSSDWEDDRGSMTEVECHYRQGDEESVHTLAHIIADSPLPLPPSYTPSPFHRSNTDSYDDDDVLAPPPPSISFPVVFPPSPFPLLNTNSNNTNFNTTTHSRLDDQSTPLPSPLPPVLLFPHPPLSSREHNGSEETRRHSSPPAFWSTFRFSRGSFGRRQR
ncbi:pheromone A receptor-domain-containing protein [Cantharellus anzutake]|uniref:pheromone A receptor-domain-containing protein n=1 Tax=Cantharellus anzutake TaxID=1750568 RepID=UPI0019076EA2|nr:pheromone A receptor-domain-containing protein [Cantharellus anzutake]KAF8332005.1 pheromone A receptor-domain-containing protein [Cantharellus anzutake]